MCWGNLPAVQNVTRSPREIIREIVERTDNLPEGGTEWSAV